MKTLTLILILVAATLAPTKNIYATPCAAVLCMYGMVSSGGGSSKCASSIAEFFSINVYNGFLGTFDPEATSMARKAFLGQCKNADSSFIGKIIDVQGMIEG